MGSSPSYYNIVLYYNTDSPGPSHQCAMSPTQNQPWRKLSGGVAVTSVLNSKKTVKPNPPLKTEAWRKPKGVVQVLGAFGTNKRQDNLKERTTKKKLQKAGTALKVVNSLSNNRDSPGKITNHRSPTQKLKNAGTVVKVVNNFSSPEQTGHRGKEIIIPKAQNQKISNSPGHKLKNAGTVVKVVNNLANVEKSKVIATQPMKGTNPPTNENNPLVSTLTVSPRPITPGILKNNQEAKKQANSVKFSPRHKVKLIEGRDIKKQSKQILKSVSKQARPEDSESDGYHSDCKHESPKRRARKPYPKRFYLDKSGRSFAKDENGKAIRSIQGKSAKQGGVNESTQQQQGGNLEKGSIYGLKEGPPVKNVNARLHWNKIGMLMRLSKTLAGNPSLILLTRGRKMNLIGWKALKSAVSVAKMTNNYISLTKGKKGSVPRSGGTREKKSFDTVDRYRQHTTPKRYDPTRENYIHTTQVRWRHYHGCVKLRDQKGINSHVYLPWNKVVTEPPSYRSMFCKCSWYFGLCRHIIRPPWDVSSKIFRSFSQTLYARLSCPFILLISMFCGFYFGTLAFLHIWAVQPLKKMMYLQGVVVRKLSQACFGEFVGSLVHIWRMMFTTSEINLNTLNSELNGIFLEKKHRPGLLGTTCNVGKIKDRSLGKYPNEKRLKLPFTKYQSVKEIKNGKGIDEDPKVFRHAVEIAKSKVFSGEIIESALRLAMAKREERFRTGQFTFRQSLKLARTRKHGQEGEEKTEEDLPMFDPTTAPWQKAKLLAFARLKRGKTNWMKAREKLISGQHLDQSFWHRAKDIVFVPKDPKDKKILKIL